MSFKSPMALIFEIVKEDEGLDTDEKLNLYVKLYKELSRKDSANMVRRELLFEIDKLREEIKIQEEEMRSRGVSFFRGW